MLLAARSPFSPWWHSSLTLLRSMSRNRRLTFELAKRELLDRYAGRRAPAHDATGHTWQHSDEDLFHMTALGRFAATSPREVSYMPAFGEGMKDSDILAVLAFIKSRWPMGLRVSQAMLNPGFAGMPADAGKTDWTLPPNCKATVRR